MKKLKNTSIKNVLLLSKYMSCQLYKYLDNLTKSNIFRTKKKNIFLVKEGIYSFKIDMNKSKPCLFCPKINQCSLKKCKHFYQVLKMLNITNISFLSINDNLKRALNNEDIVVHDSDIECNLCLSECWNSDIDIDKIYQCLSCSKLYHNTCLVQYKQTVCPFCYDKFN
jgi:hypothetical protein